MLFQIEVIMIHDLSISDKELAFSTYIICVAVKEKAQNVKKFNQYFLNAQFVKKIGMHHTLVSRKLSSHHSLYLVWHCWPVVNKNKPCGCKRHANKTRYCLNYVPYNVCSFHLQAQKMNYLKVQEYKSVWKNYVF